MMLTKHFNKRVPFTVRLSCIEGGGGGGGGMGGGMLTLIHYGYDFMFLCIFQHNKSRVVVYSLSIEKFAAEEFKECPKKVICSFI